MKGKGGEGVSFWKIQKKVCVCVCAGGSDFSHKKGGIGKIGGCFKKGGYYLFW